jgi:PhnB protein
VHRDLANVSGTGELEVVSVNNFPATSPQPGLQIAVRDTAAAIAFYTAAFGAVETNRGCLLDGYPVEAELTVGEYRVQLTEWDAAEPRADRSGLRYLCDDTDSVLGRIIAAGGLLESPSSGAGAVVRDPAGQVWFIGPR